MKAQLDGGRQELGLQIGCHLHVAAATSLAVSAFVLASLPFERHSLGRRHIYMHLQGLRCRTAEETAHLSQHETNTQAVI